MTAIPAPLPAGGISRILWLDATTCLLMGLALAMAAGPVAGLTALPEGLLRFAGLILLPIAAFMALMASGRLTGWLPLFVIVAGNVGWVIASIALALGLFVAPNTLGVAFLLAQAAVVLAFAVAEGRGLRALP